MKRLFDYLFGNKILKNSSRVIALTETEKQQYKTFGVCEEKIEIIPNGINPKEFTEYQEASKFKKKYHINRDNKIILYLGRVNKAKGIELLIDAFSKILNEYSNINLIIAGPDDGYCSYLQNMVDSLNLNEYVHFTGLLYGEEKAEAYIESDIFVTPNYTGFPITFLEACACGLPIITTEKGDRLDWLDGKVGISVKYQVENLKRGILTILKDDKLVHSLVIMEKV